MIDEVTPLVMADEDVGRFLSGLASVVRDFLRESDDAERRLNERTQATDALLARRTGSKPTLADPELAASSLRHSLAREAALRHRRAARELASWWADAATVALAAAARGTRAHAVRLVAGNAALPMEENELRQLPEVDETTLKLVEFAAWLGPAPGDASDDTRALAEDLAARSGLLIHEDASGNFTITEDCWPEARRRRLWGDLWTDHAIPRLPHPEEVPALLTGVPADAVARVRAAAEAVAGGVAAQLRVAQLQEQGELTPEEAEECETLWDQLEELTSLLAAYAQTVTDTLPAVRGRQGVRSRPGAPPRGTAGRRS